MTVYVEAVYTQKTVRLLGLAPSTVNIWKRKFGHVLAEYFFKGQKMIGGRGKTVEIDETVITTKRKYNKGRVKTRTKQIWLFGVLERGAKKFF